MKKEKVFLIGNVIGSYRSQNMIKTLLDLGHQVYYIPFTSAPISIHPIIRKPITATLSIVSIFIDTYFIIQSTVIFVPAMNFSERVILKMLIAKFLKKKIFLDYYISFYDTYVNDRQTINKQSFSSKVFLIKDRFLMTLPNRVIFLNNAEKDYYQEVIDIKLPETKIFICPLVIDPKIDFYVNKQKVWERKKREDEFIVCWWGTYIPLHGLNKIIESFTFLSHLPVKLYIFGNNEEASSAYQTQIVNLNLSKIITIKNDLTFNNGKLQLFLENNCDLALGNFGDSQKAKTVLVNKIVDCFAMGLPCLTMKTQASLELLPNNTIFYSEPTPKDIAEKIEYIMNNRDESKVIGSNGYLLYKNLFSPDVFAKKIRNLLLEDS